MHGKPDLIVIAKKELMGDLHPGSAGPSFDQAKAEMLSPCDIEVEETPAGPTLEAGSARQQLEEIAEELRGTNDSVLARLERVINSL